MSLPWIYLIVAGLLEVCWAIGLKWPSGHVGAMKCQNLFPNLQKGIDSA